MLDRLFESPTTLRQLRREPLGPYLDGLAGELLDQGYARSSGRDILVVAGALNRYARARGVRDGAAFDEALIAQFVHDEWCAGHVCRRASSATRRIVAYLRRHGVMAGPAGTDPTDPFRPILEAYDEHLQSVRGLMPRTCWQHVRGARAFLALHQQRHGALALDRIDGAEVLEYVTAIPDLRSRAAQERAGQVRSWLRFLRWRGVLTADLERVVPRVRRRRLVNVPKTLAWEHVQALLAGIDDRTPVGKRDRAMVLLLATVGLRAQEVSSLRLECIDWQAGAIRLPQTKTRRERRVPLPAEVARILEDYVLHGRPQRSVPEVFLRHHAPQGPFHASGPVSNVVLRHLTRLGIPSPSYGAHVLRHSLASRMVNEGASIKEVADVLGHLSIDTTAIYTKVDTRHLARVALPFPGGAP